MNLLDRMKEKALASPKKIIVKVECKVTGKVTIAHDCGVDQSAANAKEQLLLSNVDPDKFHVYQSITV